MKEKEALEICFKRDYLNDTGLKKIIAYNNGEVKDHSIRNIEAIKDKGLHPLACEETECEHMGTKGCCSLGYGERIDCCPKEKVA